MVSQGFKLNDYQLVKNHFNLMIISKLPHNFHILYFIDCSCRNLIMMLSRWWLTCVLILNQRMTSSWKVCMPLFLPQSLSEQGKAMIQHLFFGLTGYYW